MDVCAGHCLTQGSHYFAFLERAFSQENEKLRRADSLLAGRLGLACTGYAGAKDCTENEEINMHAHRETDILAYMDMSTYMQTNWHSMNSIRACTHT